MRYRTHSFDALAARRGFTLLELAIALSVMVILSAGIFTLASGGLELLEDVQDLQQRETRNRRFIELCRQNFESLPAGTEISFRYEQRGGHYDTYLSLRNAPSAFGFGRGDFEVRRVVLAAEIDSSGFIRASVYYLDAEADDRYERGEMNQLNVRSLPLMKRLRQLTWRFYDSSRLEWVDVLPPGSQNPVMIELTLAGEGEPNPVRSVFWVPARQIEEALPGEPQAPQDGENPQNPNEPGTGGSAPEPPVDSPARDVDLVR
ncbi:MAG: prepilin-type N-terminal cleavage/methylation domain-containing protein [Verrucomicrobiae bacterium]|nr:prepilin-type N-terminal cleavage/methylation domain-containing protein [Verrucomicrobiae bacterium]